MRGNTLLPYIDGGHALVLPMLEKVGVKVHFGTPFDSGTQEKLGCDFTLNCMGFSFAGPKRYMTGEMAKCLAPTGQIQVNMFGQVTEAHPLLAEEGKKVHNNIFSFGDTCLTPANENKSAVSLYQYGNQWTNNIY